MKGIQYVLVEARVIGQREGGFPPYPSPCAYNPVTWLIQLPSIYLWDTVWGRKGFFNTVIFFIRAQLQCHNTANYNFAFPVRERSSPRCSHLLLAITHPPGWQEKYSEVRILADAHLKLIKIPGPQRDWSHRLSTFPFGLMENEALMNIC